MNSDFVSLLTGTANALGMDPLDLATIISYETAGTFDPRQLGPTTQFGQHRGLIQFGEPQAREYGVDWNDPINSQLGPDGAIVRYFRAHGWQPGMGMLDAYSVVNAGGPGRYNASDANNGGAPGTVRDKVTRQMEGHREKAAGLLGRTYVPNVFQFGGDVPQAPADPSGVAGMFSDLPLAMGSLAQGAAPGLGDALSRGYVKPRPRPDKNAETRAALAALIR